MSKILDLDGLLALSKSIASKAGSCALDRLSQHDKGYIHCLDFPKEVKSLADEILNREILDSLAPLGIPILSEESGYLFSNAPTDYHFIVDPLDGTYNFIKGLGPSAVSIALWRKKTPVFGVIYSFAGRELFWGGAGIGAFVDDKPVFVSNTETVSKASICTGFPVRFDTDDSQEMKMFWNIIAPFGKVRMIGSAAMSLMYLARGSADAYFEKNIMLWDVAAGIAIVEGAGGTSCVTQSSIEHSLNVFSSNGRIIKNSQLLFL